MARGKSTPLRQAMSRIFPKAAVERLARQEGVIQRQRRVGAVAFFWVLVLTLGGGRERTLADLRRAYERTTGTRLAASSFYDRFTPALARFLKVLMETALSKVGELAQASRALLAPFREVLCVDSTVVRLHDALARCFPACRTNHTQAAVKLHTVLNVRGQGPQSVKLTSERVHDGPVLRAGEWVRGRLLLFDLGYFRYSLFAAIAGCGGFFLTRLKEKANPVIVFENRRHRGRAIATEGRALQEFKKELRREVFDAEAEIRFRRRTYRGRRRSATLRTRLVGLWDTKHEVYHWYLTNLAPEQVPAEEVGRLYAARWAIELLFRELKSCYALESLPSRKPHVVEALLYAAVITLLVSHTLLRGVRRWASIVDQRTPLERWARLFVSSASELLAIILDSATMARLRERLLLPFLAKEALDPNAHRSLLLDRAGLECAH
jgi:IS4 transposase